MPRLAHASPKHWSSDACPVHSLLPPLLAIVAVLAPFRPAGAQADPAPNPVTPGDFRGYGFDQCLAPTQKAMDVWLNHSPFLSVGIYISGNSRACRSQPNLTPRWIGTQLRKGWRLLPITLGPQASCSDRFPRYDDDPVIDGRPGPDDNFPYARRQARAEAVKAVDAAKALGIVPRSTLWYDLEAFDDDNFRCRESALAFLSAWTNKLHDLKYVSGVYSSAGSGIAVLDDARVERPGAYTMPDMIWLARWDGVANTSSSYIRDDGWRPGRSGEAVPRRPQRDLGRRDDQHRPQLPRPRQGQGRGARGALRRRQPRLPPVPGDPRAG